MHALLLLGLVGAVLGDSCTDYNHPKFGKVGKCISKSCCAFGTYISDLCSGDKACCFAQDNCGSGSVLGGCPNIVSRSAWGARSPTSITYLTKQPVHYAFIHHGESASCTTQSSCSAIVRSYQNYHMDTHGWSDIGYSFLVGEDGNAYEGRGWDRVGAHTQGYNSVGLAFCMIGSFDSRVPNAAAIATVKRMIACGVSKGKISQSYVLRGHRDMGSTSCPGQALYNLIRTWPHY
ncbi:peptidoglycan-recognition protein SC2 isoform X1 [Patella vulgata]|uniref:peptidoglycan-recognition protein SC2 isoform X1 n=1 Tax=Patella vulgata TaxID=6465 RepID=UPI0021802E0D|nr:peptidoglycan-recognition protein SC2 isoform X1 [Patella vulgata]